MAMNFKHCHEHTGWYTPADYQKSMAVYCEECKKSYVP